MKLTSRFLWLTFLFSMPLWAAAAFLDATKIIPIKLPFSALQFLCVLAAAILATRWNGGSVRELLLRGFDLKRIPTFWMQLVIFVIMPVTIVLSYLLTKWYGIELPSQPTPFSSLFIFLLIYTISAFCEQIGWTAIMTDELFQKGYGVIAAGLIVGVVWAVWHLIPFIQTHNTPTWIIWQCIYTILSRILFTKIYILTNRSVCSTIVLHATYDTAFSMMPYYGSSYNPAAVTAATFCTILILFTWAYWYNKDRRSETIQS